MQDRYFVETPEGTRYGPADLTTLREWAAQKRLQPDSTLVHETRGDRVRADSLGLFVSDGAGHVAAPPPVMLSAGAPMMGAPYVQPAKPGRSPFLIVGLVLGAMCLCSVPILGAVLFPVFAQAKKAAQRTTGLSNTKQLGVGVLIYQGDFDDHYPLHMESAKALEPAISKYVRNPKVFVSVNPKGGEVLGDKRLSGRSMLDLLAPDQTAMLYDSVAWDGGRVAVGYADGHAKFVQESLMASLLAPDPFGGVKAGKESP